MSRHDVATDNPRLDHMCCEVSADEAFMCLKPRGHDGPHGDERFKASPATSPPTLRHLCENAKAHGYDSLIISTQVLDESLDAHAQQIATLRGQLAEVDAVLSRRTALDGEPDRIRKIALAIKIAQSNDPKGELAAAEARATTAERDAPDWPTLNAHYTKALELINSLREDRDRLQRELDAEVLGNASLVCENQRLVAETTRLQGALDEMPTSIIAAVGDAFDAWRVKLPSDRGFNHPEGLAFIEALQRIHHHYLALSALRPEHPRP